jgi:anaerobic magnesium-protoporphyrin IX monomethyl ester cyclase
MESASPALLERLDKGVGPEQARAVLRACSAAGIKNHVYLLWGQPGETDAEREETLRFVEAEGAHIHDLNNALLNLPRGAPMHRHPERYGITAISPFADDTDLSLYDDFRCGDRHPRLEARRWLGRRFFKSGAARGIQGGLKGPFGANHSCFLP